MSTSFVSNRQQQNKHDQFSSFFRLCGADDSDAFGKKFPLLSMILRRNGLHGIYDDVGCIDGNL
jgi:hypothetical protein